MVGMGTVFAGVGITEGGSGAFMAVIGTTKFTLRLSMDSGEDKSEADICLEACAPIVANKKNSKYLQIIYIYTNYFK